MEVANDNPSTDNVVIFDGPTRLDIPCSRVVRAALEKDFEDVLLIGVENGELYFVSNTGDKPKILYLLEKAKNCLLNFN